MDISELYEWLEGIEESWTETASDRYGDIEGDTLPPALLAGCGIGLSFHEPGFRYLVWR